MQSGPQAIRVLHRPRRRHALKTWTLQLPASKPRATPSPAPWATTTATGSTILPSPSTTSVLLFRNLGKGKFQDVTAEAGLAPRNHPTGITFVDYDHDGDLDLFLTGEPLKAGDAPNVLWRNNGNKTFTEWTEPTGLGGSGKTAAAILTDFNNDRAVDLAVTGDGPRPILYVNPREGKYPTQPLYDEKLPANAQASPSSTSTKTAGWTSPSRTRARPGLTLWRNVDGPTTIGPPLRARRLCRFTMHCAAGASRPSTSTTTAGSISQQSSKPAAGPQVRVFRNRGDGSFEDVSHALGLDAIKLECAARPHCRRCGRRRRARSDRDPAQCAARAAAQCGRKQESLRAPRSDRLRRQQDRASAQRSKSSPTASGRSGNWPAHRATRRRRRRRFSSAWAKRRASTCSAFSGPPASCRTRSICRTRR